MTKKRHKHQTISQMMSYLALMCLLLCSTAMAQSTYWGTYNELASSLKFQPRLENCNQIANGFGCAVTGTKAGGNFAATVVKGVAEVDYFIALPNVDARSMQEVKAAYMLMAVMADNKITDDVIGLVAALADDGLKKINKSSATRKVRGNTYYFKVSNLKALGLGDGYVINCGITTGR